MQARKKEHGQFGLLEIGELLFALKGQMWSPLITEIIIDGGCVMATRRRPTHPGEVIREDIIKPLGLTVTEAASRLRVTRKTLSALINCRAALSPEMAIRIGKATGTSPESWIYMQAKLDLWRAQQKPMKVDKFRKLVAA